MSARIPKTVEEKALARGMAIMLAEISRWGCCQQGTIEGAAEDAGLTIEVMKAAEVDPYDLNQLRPYLARASLPEGNGNG